MAFKITLANGRIVWAASWYGVLRLVQSWPDMVLVRAIPDPPEVNILLLFNESK